MKHVIRWLLRSTLKIWNPDCWATNRQWPNCLLLLYLNSDVYLSTCSYTLSNWINKIPVHMKTCCWLIQPTTHNGFKSLSWRSSVWVPEVGCIDFHEYMPLANGLMSAISIPSMMPRYSRDTGGTQTWQRKLMSYHMIWAHHPFWTIRVS